jgi:CubicO group peptidase (beta-lactamase class C family)
MKNIGRRTMYLISVLIAAPAFALANLPATSATSPNSQDAKVVESAERIVQEFARDAHFNGAVVLMRNGAVVYERAVGLAQRSPDRPFTTDTPSDGGSLAKTITAALLYELVAEGRLRFDDPVVRHLPSYPYPKHTVLDLVSHRSGLPDYGFFDADFKPGQARDTNDLLSVLARRKPKPVFAQGVQVEYDNLAFDLAALIAERVTGQKLASLFRERYFKRLGMDSTFARPARFADWPVARTVGYQLKNDKWQLFDVWDGEGFIGASNVQASARDWARWGDAFARGTVMPPERLAAGLREPMLNTGMDNKLSRLSWYCDSEQQRCHYTGVYNGFFSQVYWDRSRGDVVAYVSNSNLAPLRGVALTHALVDVLAGREPSTGLIQQPLRIKKQDLPRWAGTYRAPEIGLLRITTSGGRAFVRVGTGELTSLFRVSAEVLYAPTLDLTFTFSGTPKDATVHLRSVFVQSDAKRVSAGSAKP